MKRYKIRAHHGMCLAYFQGKGYSSEFTQNMAYMKSILEQNADITVISSTDDICSKCPNSTGKNCLSDSKVLSYDQAVLDACHISAGTEMTWNEFTEKVNKYVLSTGLRPSICGDCQWNELCK